VPSKTTAKKKKDAPAPFLAVGDNVDAKCGKCKDVTKHIVLAKIGWKPTRVECCVCSATHEFKPPRPASRRRVAPAPELSPEEEWKFRMKAAKEAAKPYDRERAYAVGEVIAHQKFGDGAVISRASETVCEVVFETGTVKLIMATRATRRSR